MSETNRNSYCSAEFDCCPIVAVAAIASALSILAGCRAENVDRDLGEPLTVNEADGDGPVASALERVRSTTLDLVGIRYRYGGATPQSGFYCSGFVQYVIRHTVRSNIARAAASLASEGRRVKRDQPSVSDLVF